MKLDIFNRKMLLDRLHDCQNGDASCMKVMKEIEAAVEREMESPENKKSDKLQVRVWVLEDAIKWALGEKSIVGPFFRTREEGEGTYWWRKELRKRYEQTKR